MRYIVHHIHESNGLSLHNKSRDHLKKIQSFVAKERMGLLEIVEIIKD